MSSKRIRTICHVSSTAGTVADRTELELLTVKELHQRIKDWGLESKGLSGKRKADLIDYMVESMNGNAVVDFEREEEAPPEQISATKRQGTRMPPMPPTASINGEEHELNGSSSSTNNGESEINPAKAKIYRDVLSIYPPLCEYINRDTLEHFDPTGNSKPDGLGEHDIRHEHHPMLKGTRYSDLDVVFVGTASCTPGMTRGVSCTALRLQWRRKRGHVLGTKKGKDKKKNGANNESDVNHVLSADGKYDESGNGDFNGGEDGSGRTWLFDCGESTQVSCAAGHATYSIQLFAFGIMVMTRF